MGNGPNPTPDVSKARAWAASAILADAVHPIRTTDEQSHEPEDDCSTDAGSGARDQQPPAEPVHYCARTRRLKIQALDDVTLELDCAVWLVKANPPRVAVVTNQLIGVVVDPRDSAIQQCLIDGYVMSGRVVAVDPTGTHGEIQVAGRLD